MSAPRDPRYKRIEAGVVEESLDELYEQAPCGYVSTLPDGTIARVNQTLLDWTGYTREGVIGVRLQTLLGTGSRIYYETHYAPLLEMQGAVQAIALEVRCADGRILPVLLNARQRRHTDGTPLFNRITLIDSTDRRRYERELLLARRKAEQVAQDKADLVAMLSHDIRNPLNALMGVVQILERGELPPSMHRFVRLLKSSSENMLNLLNQVLELSRAESSSFALVETAFSLSEVVEGVRGTFEVPARDKGIALRASIDPRVPEAVIGDPIALRQVLTNLVANAVKFTHQGSVELSVSVRQLATDAVTLYIAVTDTGIGIPAEELERIFNEFTQASYETTMRFGGSGLGLAITRKLLALYGSSVDVTSAPGVGSTFSFSLRLALAPGT